MQAAVNSSLGGAEPEEDPEAQALRFFDAEVAAEWDRVHEGPPSRDALCMVDLSKVYGAKVGHAMNL